MMKLLMTFLLIFGLLQASGWSLADSSLKFKILDLDAAKPVNIETVAESLCARNSDQIARISTFRNLLPYMRDAQESGNKLLRECATKYSAILDQMDQLIQPTADGVCEMEYADAIKSFIDRFIGRLSSDRKRRRNKKHPDEAPPMLANFFLHHAYEVSFICRRVMIDNMRSGLPSQPANLLKNFYMWNLEDIFSDPKYLDIPLATGDWLASSERIRGRVPYMGELSEIMKAIQPKPDVDHYTMFMKVQYDRDFFDVQRVCEIQFRPIYSAIILPLEKLKNMGFYGKHEHLPELEMDQTTNLARRNWYRVSQTCESIRSIAFVKDKDLFGRDALVITRQEAERSTEFKLRRDEIKKIASENSYTPRVRPTGLKDDLLRTVEWENTKDMSKKIKKNARESDVYAFGALTSTLYRVSRRIDRSFFNCVVSEAVTGKKEYLLTFEVHKELDMMNKWYKKAIYYGKKVLSLLVKVLYTCIAAVPTMIGLLIFGALIWVLKKYSGWPGDTSGPVDIRNMKPSKEIWQ